MPANSIPRFTKQGAINSVLVTAANTSSQGDGTIGTTNFLAFTANASNGSFVDRVRWMPTATTPTTTSATVGRVFVSSVTSGATTSANTYLIGEVSLSSVNADNTTVSVAPIDLLLGFTLPANWTILVTNHSAPTANTAWRAVVIAGDY